MKSSEFQVIPAERGWVLLEPIVEIGTVVDVYRSEIIAWAVRFYICQEDKFPVREIYPISIPRCFDPFTYYWAAMSPSGKINDSQDNEFATIENLILHFNKLRGER